MITQEQLKAFVHYDPETGIFTRRVSRGRNQFGAEFERWKAGTVMGRINNSGYLRISIFGKIWQGHRLAWLYHFGTWPKHQIDHINGAKADNRISNLRDVPQSENGKNQRRHTRNKTGINGVHIATQDGKYISQIRVDGNPKHLGCYDNIFDAACARKAAELRYGFHVNHGRVQ